VSKPLEQDLDEELREAGDEVTKQLKDAQQKMIDKLDLSEFAIDDGMRDFSEAHAHVAALAAGKKGLGTVISRKSTADGKPHAKRKGENGEGGDEQRKKKKTRRTQGHRKHSKS